MQEDKGKEERPHCEFNLLRERVHYHTKCPKKNMVKWKKPEGEWKKKIGFSCQGRAPKVRGKVIPNLNFNSQVNSSTHSLNTYIYLHMKNYGFKYHDRTKIIFMITLGLRFMLGLFCLVRIK